MTDTFFDIETSGLDPFNDQILTIQVKRGERVQLWKLWEEDNESDMIEKYFRFLDNIDSKEAIYGYNILLFDLPFIWTRVSVSSLNSISKNTGYSTIAIGKISISISERVIAP